MPAAVVTAIDAPSVNASPRQLVPVAAATVSVRLAPSDNVDDAAWALERHLRDRVPWGAQVDIKPVARFPGFESRADDAFLRCADRAFEAAWGVPPLHVGNGGSIAAATVLERLNPDAPVLIVGLPDEESHIHGVDESLDEAEFERGCVALTLLLDLLATSSVVAVSAEHGRKQESGLETPGD
jgi:acetylornithine deacetylase/succinyl-diaminopimelate desuccinylase-like protein